MPITQLEIKNLVHDIERAVPNCKHYKDAAKDLLAGCRSVLPGLDDAAIQGQRGDQLLKTLKGSLELVQKLSASGFILFLQKSDIKEKFARYKSELNTWNKSGATMEQKSVSNDDKNFEEYKAQATKHKETASKIHQGNKVKVDLNKFTIDASRVKKGEKLGSFTFGDVFMGTIDDKHSVHVKQLREDLDQNHKDAIKRGILINRYLQECDNIIQLKFLAGSNMILMEATTYPSLHSLFKQGINLDNQQKITIALKVAAAVAYIHECNIIHRDIRGSNIGINSTGSGDSAIYEPKLGGFESCRDQASFSLVEIPMTVWDAPERLRYGTSFHTDVYSFGVFMWEISQQAEPEPEMKLESLQALEYGNVSKEYSELMLRCLAEKSDARPAMKVVAEELSKMASVELHEE